MTLLEHPTAFLWLLPMIPVAGALMAAALPQRDRLALRAVALGALVVGLVVTVAIIHAARDPLAGNAAGLVGMVPAWLPATRLSAWVAPAIVTVALVAPLALRAGAPRVRLGMAPYVVCVLAQTGCTLTALILDDVVDALSAAIVGGIPGFALVALFGGPERGTVTWRAAALGLVVDGMALSILVGGPGPFPPEIVVVALLGPGLVRLAAGPHGLWALPMFEMAPVASAVTAAAMSAPLGAVLLVRGAQVAGPEALTTMAHPIAVVLGGAVGIGAALVAAERDLRRIGAHWMGLLGSIAALGILGAVIEGRSPMTGVLLACQTGLAVGYLLMVVEAIERRLESRRVTQMTGLATAAPMLAVLLPLAVMLVAGVPGPGTAPTLWAVIAQLAASTTPGFAGAALWCIAAVLVGVVGAAGVVTRVVTPQKRKHVQFIRVTFSQGIRLLIPLGAMVLAALSTGTFERLAGQP